MRTIKEASHDTKIPAAAAQGPKQVWVVRRTGSHQLPIGQHDIRFEQVIDRQTESPREITVATAEREARDARRRDNSRRHGQSKSMRRVIHGTLCATSFPPDGAIFGINTHTLH